MLPMANKLSPTQNLFIKELFGNCHGNVKNAAKAVLGTEDYSSLMTDDLIEAIRGRADAELALQAPKAIHTITRMLEEPENMMFMDKLHKVCADVLDRIGVSKQERHTVGQVAIGIVLLPTKEKLPEPPTIEHSQTIEGPILLTRPVVINDLQT